MKEHGNQVTLDDLAIMVGKGFTAVDEQFVEVRASIKEVDRKVDLARYEIAELCHDYKKLVTRIENLEVKAFGSVQEA